MFTTVMVGVDKAEGGRDAVALARHLVAPDGALIEAHVEEIGTIGKFDMGPEVIPHPVDGGSDEKALIEVEGMQVSVQRIVSTSTGRGLHELAEEAGADLVVVGSTRHGLLGRVMIGDHTREAINGASCAVAVAPSGYAKESGEIKRIGVAYDGSDESKHALGIARKLATEHNAAVAAMKVAKLPTNAYATTPVPLREIVAPMLKEAHDEVAALGDVEPHSGYGDVAEELTHFSGTVDLLVVGSRGYGPLGRLVHSSVSRRLARTSRCPLLVLTRAAREHDAATGQA